MLFASLLYAKQSLWSILSFNGQSDRKTRITNFIRDKKFYLYSWQILTLSHYEFDCLCPTHIDSIIGLPNILEYKRTLRKI